MMRPTDKAVLDKMTSPSVNEPIYLVLFCVVCWLLSSWLMESLVLGFLLLPVAVFVIVGAALLLMAVAAPVLAVLFYAITIIATPFLCLFKKI